MGKKVGKRTKGTCDNCSAKDVEVCQGCDHCFECACFDCCNCRNCDDCCGCDDKTHKHCQTCRSEGNGMHEDTKQRLKDEGTSAAYRVAARQGVKILRAPLLSMLQKKGASAPLLLAVEGFLSTEFGFSLLQYGVGMAINHLPLMAGHPKAMRLAEEMRVDAMATTGNGMIDEVMQLAGPMVKELTSFINAQPEVTEEKAPPLLLETTTVKAPPTKVTASRSKR